MSKTCNKLFVLKCYFKLSLLHFGISIIEKLDHLDTSVRSRVNNINKDVFVNHQLLNYISNFLFFWFCVCNGCLMKGYITALSVI